MDWAKWVIAIMFAATGCVVLGYLAINGNQSAFTALTTILSAVIFFAFGIKIGQTMSKQ